MAKSRSIFKYVSPDYVEKVFSASDVVTLKCSLPKEFNDPYELFLTIDFNERPDALAFYADAIGELPQLPTTCFSRSPIVLPMWAHYAQNLQGFAVEFSEKELAKAFPEARIDNVNYSNTPRTDLSDLLYRAYVIGKYRYTYFLRGGVFNAAYFTKASCWRYEQERRMLVPTTEIRKDRRLTLLDVPISCIVSVISGPRASKQTKRKLRKRAERIGCRYFELRIGKSSAIPYFVDGDGRPFSFSKSAISASGQHCEECKEPLVTAAEQCSWCQIDDELQRHAASRNPYRLLHRSGLLDQYVADMDAISKRRRK